MIPWECNYWKNNDLVCSVHKSSLMLNVGGKNIVNNSDYQYHHNTFPELVKNIPHLLSFPNNPESNKFYVIVGSSFPTPEFL